MPELTVLILAGGTSARMGADKAWLEVGGAPLVEYVALRLAPLASEILIGAGGREGFEAVAGRLPGASRVVYDRHSHAGPLAGLHVGLSESRTDLVLAVATDMPFVVPDLIALLVDRAEGCDAVVPLTPSPGGAEPRPEPLLAVYRRSCLPAIESALNAHRRRTTSFYDDVTICYVSPEELTAVDPQLLSFVNINTPEEWAQAQARLHRS